MRSLYIETTGYIFICLAIYAFDPQASEWLAYYHTGLSQFELWRLITATFCHTNFYHLAMNMAGLLITLALFMHSYQRTQLLPLIVFNSLFIGVCLYYLNDEILRYVGFSGVLHGLFSYGVSRDLANRDKWGMLLGAGLVIKLAHEQLFGAQQSTVALIAAPVAVDAHLYGAIAGVLFYIVQRYLLSHVFKQAQ